MKTINKKYARIYQLKGESILLVVNLVAIILFVLTFFVITLSQN